MKLVWAFLFLFLLPFYAQASEVARWTIIPQESAINFEATEKGIPFQGHFGAFTGSILFDENNLAASSAQIEIDITSATTGLAGRDADMQKPDWFDAPQFPKAVFKTTSFEKKTDGTFIAKGTLTIRDKTLPIIVPFKLTTATAPSSQVTSVMTSEITLNRLDYGVGQGAWVDVETIGNPVKVMLKVVALKN